MRIQTSGLITAVVATGLFVHVQVASAADLYSNGGLSTGATTDSGIAAPPGTNWSECQDDGAGTANTSAGSTVSAPTFRLADDFTVPAGGWTIREISFYGYQTNAGGLSIGGVNLQIWDGPPNDPLSTIVFGDTTTNRLGSAVMTDIFRTFSTDVPAAALPTVLRHVQEARALIETAPGVGLTLPAGTYWIDWQLTQNANYGTTGTGAIFAPAKTIVGARNAAGDNALQSNAGVWAPVLDTGNPAAGPDVPLDFPFVIRDSVTTGGGGPSCPGDINGDGVVGVADLLGVIAAWGVCP